MIEPELLITGEAVALEITPATVANRIASGLIDYTVYALGAALSVFAVLGLVIGDGSALKEDLALLKALLSLVALAWDTPWRLHALGIAAGFWVILSLALVLRIRSLLKGHPEPFPLSRQVLADDLRSLKEDLERERNSES